MRMLDNLGRMANAADVYLDNNRARRSVGATDQLADYSDHIADALTEAQIQLAMAPIGMVAQAVAESLRVSEIATKITGKWGLLKCKECAKELIKAFKAKGIQGKEITIQVGDGFVMSKTYPKEAISRNGKHVGVEVNGIVSKLLQNLF
jgi:hypothetical protein